MKRLADGVWQLKGFPPDAINVYLIEDVLIDAGTRHAAKRILKQLEGRGVNAHALTHAHPDHQGSSDEVCGRLGIPYWVGERDVPFAEDPQAIAGCSPRTRSTASPCATGRAPGAMSTAPFARATRSRASK